MDAGTDDVSHDGANYQSDDVAKCSALDGADLLAQSLKTERVAFVPGRAFYADGSNGNTLRLSFSCANEAQIDEGMKRLGRLIRANA